MSLVIDPFYINRVKKLRFLSFFLVDCIVHAVGFAPSNELNGNFVDVTTREGFKIAHDISAYSFVALAKAGKESMKGRKGSLITLTYLGSQKTLPNYNVMGLAKASLEASVRFLAVSLGKEGHFCL